jgi:hypothetical protein
MVPFLRFVLTLTAWIVIPPLVFCTLLARGNLGLAFMWLFVCMCYALDQILEALSVNRKEGLRDVPAPEEASVEEMLEEAPRELKARLLTSNDGQDEHVEEKIKERLEG